ncbi:MAG: serine hydrolase [Patescibacteria group bacterium]|jgi:beta-lactamase class A
MNSNKLQDKTKFIRRKIIQCFLALFVLAISSLLIKEHYFNKKDINITKEAEAKSEEIVPKPVQLPKEIDPTQTTKSLENYLTNLSGEYGYSVIDLKSNKSYGSRESNQYFMASTCKVAISAYLYSQIESGKINPNTKLIFQKRFYENGTGILQFEKPGKSYKISYLNELMIQKSDNVATNILINYLGVSNIQTFLNNYKITGMNISSNTTTPKAMSSLLQKIYKNEIISKESTDKLIYLMINSIDDDRIVAGVPANIIVAHKIGSYGKTTNDVGIVYLKHRPYVISIYSKKTLKQDIAEIAIAKISQTIFEFEDSQ